MVEHQKQEGWWQKGGWPSGGAKASSSGGQGSNGGGDKASSSGGQGSKGGGGSKGLTDFPAKSMPIKPLDLRMSYLDLMFCLLGRR